MDGNESTPLRMGDGIARLDVVVYPRLIVTIEQQLRSSQMRGEDEWVWWSRLSALPSHASCRLTTSSDGIIIICLSSVDVYVINRKEGFVIFETFKSIIRDVRGEHMLSVAYKAAPNVACREYYIVYACTYVCIIVCTIHISSSTYLRLIFDLSSPVM